MFFRYLAALLVIPLTLLYGNAIASPFVTFNIQGTQINNFSFKLVGTDCIHSSNNSPSCNGVKLGNNQSCAKPKIIKWSVNSSCASGGHSDLRFQLIYKGQLCTTSLSNNHIGLIATVSEGNVEITGLTADQITVLCKDPKTKQLLPFLFGKGIVGTLNCTSNCSVNINFFGINQMME